MLHLRTRDHHPLLPFDRVPRVKTTGEPLVLWRTWIVAPEPSRVGQARPMLTGLFGFPWRRPELDAKCTLRSPAGPDAPGGRLLDRHHRVIPDPDCTCGIYASRHMLQGPPAGLLPRGRPLVTGFVELSGHLLVTGSSLRAQHARIVGPLHLSAGRKPWVSETFTVAGAARSPRSVVEGGNAYRVRWAPGPGGDAYPGWRARVAPSLADRYGVPVLPG